MSSPTPSEETLLDAARKIVDEQARADYLSRVCGENAELLKRLQMILSVEDDQVGQPG